MQCDSGANVAGNNSKPDSPTPKVLTGVVNDKEKKMDKQTLAQRVEPLDISAARIIEDEDSQINEVDAPFLRDGKIYEVSKFARPARS